MKILRVETMGGILGSTGMTFGVRVKMVGRRVQQVKPPLFLSKESSGGEA